MADDSINKYQEMLKQYRASQDMLTDYGLPEATNDPVQDMIDKANAEMKDQKAIEAQAKLDEQKLKNSNNLTAEYNLDDQEEDRIMSNIENSVKSGSMGKEDQEVLKSLKESATPREKSVTPPVSVPTPQADPSAQPNYQQLLERVRQLRTSDLSEAKKDRAMSEAMADISEGIAKFGAGYGAGKGAPLKADTSMAELMRKRATRGFQEAEAGRKSEIEQAGMEIKAQQEAAKLARAQKLDDLNKRYKEAQIQKLNKEEVGKSLSKDPNSEESKAAQEQAMNMMGSMGIKYDPEKIGKLNAETLGSKQFTASLRKSVNKLSEKKHNSTETERFNKWTEKKEDDLVKAVDKFNKDKEVVRANSMISGSKIARDMVESGNPIAAASVPNFLARASGEVGALTEADKEPFGGTRAIVERSKQAMQQMVDGNLTEANKRFVIELSKVYEKTAKNVKDGRADEMAGQLGGIDFPVQMLRGRFMGTDTTALPEQVLPKTPAMLEGRDKQAYEWAISNENDPRAKQILKKLGM